MLCQEVFHNNLATNTARESFLNSTSTVLTKHRRKAYSAYYKNSTSLSHKVNGGIGIGGKAVVGKKLGEDLLGHVSKYFSQRNKPQTRCNHTIHDQTSF